jgi:hypothetical protein
MDIPAINSASRAKLLSFVDMRNKIVGMVALNYGGSMLFCVRFMADRTKPLGPF